MIKPLICLLLCLPVSSLADTFLFSAPPKENRIESNKLYLPIANLLSKKTGHKFIYKHPQNWLYYQQDVLNHHYHLLFNDAHFVSWGITQEKRTPLIRLAASSSFATVVDRNSVIYSKDDLIGRQVCADSPPDLGTLDLLSKYQNPLRMPQVVVTNEPASRLMLLRSGKCEAALLPVQVYKKLPKDDFDSKIVYQSDALPGSAFTVDSGLSEDLQNRIRTILLSDEGQQATAALVERHGNGQGFISAETDDYLGLVYLLEGYPGFDF